ncbi:MAG: hypothetical protein ACJAVK_001714 [Akkermansiaceae bacterium]|jgi:hypothetical protein
MCFVAGTMEVTANAMESSSGERSYKIGTETLGKLSLGRGKRS